jgi:hypothetical protein
VCSPNMPGTVCSSRFTGGSSEDWLDAINTARENQQKAFGGSFTPSEWSPDLANKAHCGLIVLPRNVRMECHLTDLILKIMV